MANTTGPAPRPIRRRIQHTIRVAHPELTNPEGIEIRNNAKTIQAHLKRGYFVVSESIEAPAPTEAKRARAPKEEKQLPTVNAKPE